MCHGNFGDFQIMNMENEPILVNVIEQIMGHYMYKQKRQHEPTPLSIEEGALIPTPDESSQKKTTYMSKFFVLDQDDNQKNIEENKIVEPYMLKRMPGTMYEDLFEIGEKNKFSATRDVLVTTVYN